MPVDAPAAPQRPETNFAAIMIGSLVALAVQLLLGLFASAVGLAFRDPTAIGIVTGSLMGVLVVVASMAGGVATALLLRPRFPWVVELHALGTWALTVMAVIILSTQSLASPLGSLVSVAAAGAAAAKASDGQGQLGELLSEVNPVILTDIELFKGRLVTTIETSTSAPELLDAVRERTKELTGHAEEDVEQATKEVKGGVSIGALVGSLALLLTAMATVLAARFTARRLDVA